MLDLLSSGAVQTGLDLTGLEPLTQPAESVVWRSAAWTLLPSAPDPVATQTLQKYQQWLKQRGFELDKQGIWLQSGAMVLASNQGQTPFPAASLTKVATSLAALQKWGPNHQFETLVSATGPIQNGVLQGDLVVQGNGDPLLVWEEAIALGNALQRLGIRKVTGRLVVLGNFWMNFETDPQKAGEFFKQAINAAQWSSEIANQHAALPTGTPRPQVEIVGPVQVVTYGQGALPTPRPLLRHQSLTLVQIIKLMNIYSNNMVADSLAELLGGATAVSQTAAYAAGVPPQEIRLKNGSGLGVENQISPRAASAMFAALLRYGQTFKLSLADLFPVAELDSGTIGYRKLPADAVVKTGTLNTVSALAGVLPTRDRGLVWFTIINWGGDLEGFRQQQDWLLQELVRQWGPAAPPPIAVVPSQPTASNENGLLGDQRRIQAVQSAVDVQYR